MKYSSTNGFRYIKYTVAILSEPLLGTKECGVVYDADTNAFYLSADGTTATQGPLAPGANATLTDAECTLNGVGSLASGSGNTLTVVANVTFSASYGASQNIYMLAMDQGGMSSGYVNNGTTASSSNTPPTADSVTQIAIDSLTQSNITFKYSSANGYQQLKSIYAAFGPTLSPSGTCVVWYDNVAGAFSMLDDAGTSTLGPLSPGAAGNLHNAQCMLAGTGSTVLGATNTLTMTLNLTFSAAFGKVQNIFMYAAARNGLTSGWQTRGNIASTAAPTADSFTGFAQGSDNQTLTFQYSSVNGGAYINDVYVLINTGFSSSNGCIVLWDRPSKRFFLMDNAGSTFLGPLTAANLSNSQCTLNFTGTQASTSGRSVKTTLNLVFNRPLVTGTQQVWMYAYDSGGNVSGWVQRGAIALP